MIFSENKFMDNSKDCAIDCNPSSENKTSISDNKSFKLSKLLLKN